MVETIGWTAKPHWLRMKDLRESSEGLVRKNFRTIENLKGSTVRSISSLESRKQTSTSMILGARNGISISSYEHPRSASMRRHGLSGCHAPNACNPSRDTANLHESHFISYMENKPKASIYLPDLL